MDMDDIDPGDWAMDDDNEGHASGGDVFELDDIDRHQVQDQ
jgi:hypothetical protein